MKYLIADLVTELTPKYELLNSFAEKFKYSGDRLTDITLDVSQTHIDRLLKRMKHGTTAEQAESFAVGNAFFKQSVKHGVILLHSSAITVDGKAYMFCGESGIGKSTHTRLWKTAFGDRVDYINDDKPALRVIDNKAVAFGTPFDGGSGIAENRCAPVGAIVFLERSQTNFIRPAKSDEILKNLYFSTVHMLNAQAAEKMLDFFEKLIGTTRFYVLGCTPDISAAHTAYDGIIK